MKKIMFNDSYGLTKAVLEGRKTMTRRIVNFNRVPTLIPGRIAECCLKYAPFKPGEVVAIAQNYEDAGIDPETLLSVNGKWVTACGTPGWRNKMFVSADYMNNFIRITNVRVERLQDISDEDCKKEGIDYVGGYSESYYFGHGVENIRLGNSYREAFAALIVKVSSKGTWKSNPWVFVYQFEIVK